MIATARRVDNWAGLLCAVPPPRQLSPLRFFLRYPIFLLAFGPPEFKPPVIGVDTSQAHFDAWNVIQVGWLSAIALRAILRLAGARSITIPRQIRRVLKIAFVLGILFVVSVAYSPGRVISGEYCVLYFLNFVCVVEFVATTHRDSLDWMQCIFQLRLVALLLVATVLLTLFFNPILVLHRDGRLMGGSIASMPFYCPIIAIVSAYTFLHLLEGRFRAGLCFMLGVAGTAMTQTRGGELALTFILLMIAIRWATINRRFAHLAISGTVALTLLAGTLVALLGLGPIWQAFNRGQDMDTIVTASGRTGVWEDQILYCITHPQGMGYVAGVRAFHRRDYASNLHAALTNIGGTDNSYMEVLTDAGWLALLLYMTFIFKILSLGWRFAKRKAGVTRTKLGLYHLFNCAIFLMVFCLAEGVESSKYVVPLFGPFYAQNILIAVLLAASGNVMISSRFKAG
jgi:O-Antigen ligase